MGPDGEMPPTEVLRRLVDESDEEYLSRLVDARSRVVNARIAALEARMLTMLDGFQDVKERQDKQEERHERTMREFFEQNGQILTAIREVATSRHESCRAAGQMAADAVRAYGASWRISERVGFPGPVRIVSPPGWPNCARQCVAR